MRRLSLLVVLILLALPTPARADTGLHLYIPRLLLDVPVGECALVGDQYDLTRLGNGICHLEGTATLDTGWARIVLAGHTPGGFAELPELREGDQIMVWDGAQVKTYTVRLVAVVGVSDTQWLMPTPDDTLTLITCAGARRLIIFATREDG